MLSGYLPSAHEFDSIRSIAKRDIDFKPIHPIQQQNVTRDKEISKEADEIALLLQFRKFDAPPPPEEDTSEEQGTDPLDFEFQIPNSLPPPPPSIETDLSDIQLPTILPMMNDSADRRIKLEVLRTRMSTLRRSDDVPNDN